MTQKLSLFAQFEDKTEQAADFLRALANAHRLQVLCLLIEHREMSVGQIQAHTTLSQSALSQHLAKMREEGLVTYRRHAQTLYYSLCDEKTIKVLAVLKEYFCPPDKEHDDKSIQPNSPTGHQ